MLHETSLGSRRGWQAKLVPADTRNLLLSDPRRFNIPCHGYNFDTDFQNIGQLPPGTPRFSDVNALSFTQSVLPN